MAKHGREEVKIPLHFTPHHIRSMYSFLLKLSVTCTSFISLKNEVLLGSFDIVEDLSLQEVVSLPVAGVTPSDPVSAPDLTSISLEIKPYARTSGTPEANSLLLDLLAHHR